MSICAVPPPARMTANLDGFQCIPAAHLLRRHTCANVVFFSSKSHSATSLVTVQKHSTPLGAFCIDANCFMTCRQIWLGSHFDNWRRSKTSCWNCQSASCTNDSKKTDGHTLRLKASLGSGPFVVFRTFIQELESAS